MNNRKGLSQILFLIIAASVLMMAALSLVFMLNEGLSGITDFGGDASATACERQAQAACSGHSGTADLPSACTTTDAQDNTQQVQGVNQDGFTIDFGSRTLDCEP